MLLSLVYGQRIAANPHARNSHQWPLFPASVGNRAFRRKLRSQVRTGNFDA